MKLSDHQFEFLKDVCLLILWADRRGYKVTGGELWRSPETQLMMVKAGKSNTTKGKHPSRLAIDLNLFIDNVYRSDTEAYRPLGEFWESLNPFNRWGGNFTTIKDGNHFERNVR